MGTTTLTVVAVFKPGKYPTRIFYTRKWTPPEGETFGKNRLRVTTAQAFRTLCKGYRFEYRIDAEAAEWEFE